ncbi:MAG: hypothetical protein FWG92_07390 [Leptospirales bacterium]|nr:hypothetical protein [Leptospirales bacterium]
MQADFICGEKNPVTLFYLDDDRLIDMVHADDGFFLGSENGFIEVFKFAWTHCFGESSYYISGFCENIRAACGESIKNDKNDQSVFLWGRVYNGGDQSFVFADASSENLSSKKY